MCVDIPEELAEFAESLSRQIAESAERRGVGARRLLFYFYLCSVGVLGDAMEKVEVVKTRRGVARRLPPPEPIAEEIMMCVRDLIERGRGILEKYDYYA